ncbi:MAG: hypothetical protein ABIO79_06215 [Ferruginibacter sp.]
MKKNYFLFLLAMFSCAIAFAQVPQAVPYQAVARNAAGNLIANQSISVRLSILDGSSVGPMVFRESHTVSTNQFGLFTVNLGQGTLLNGTFPGINWAVNAKFLKVEFDPAGGSSFVDMGTSQLLSVPYALFSGSGGNLPNGTLAGNTLRWNGSTWIADNGIFNDGNKVGLGTTEPGLGVNPTAKIDIRDEDGANSDISQTVAGGGFPVLIWTKQKGTLAAPQPVSKGTFVGGIQGSYFNGTDHNLGAAIYYVADTTSAVSSPTSIQFRTTGTDSTRNLTRMIIKHNGKIGIGTTNPGSGSSPTARLDIQDEDGANSDINQTVAGPGFPVLIWTKQRGTLAAPQAVIKNTFLGGVQGNYFNGSDYSLGAAMYYVADTTAANSFPASIQFRTTGVDSARNLTRMIIKHNGKIGIGTTQPGVGGSNPYARLDIRDEDGSNSDINQLVAGMGIPAITWAQQAGTLASPAPIVTGSTFGRLDGNYYTANGYSQGNSRAASIFFRADTLVDSGNPGSIYFATAKYGQTIPTTNLVIKHNGNVGIGTPVPDRKLDVRGGVKIVDGTQGAGKLLTSDAAGNASWQLPSGGGGSEPHVAFFAGNTDFTTAGTQSIPATTLTTVQFGEGFAFFNDGTGYNSTTNRFTPPTAGVYQLNVTLNYQGTPGEIIDITLRLGNGGHIVKGIQTIPASGSGVITLAATYNSINSSGAQIWVDAYATSATTILKTESGFSGHLVYTIPQ